MTRDEAARALGVATPEVRSVEDTEYGAAVVMSSGARRLIAGDGFYATDDHPANKHLRRFHFPDKVDGDPEPAEEPGEEPGEDEESDPAPEGVSGEVPDGSVADVLAWVGEDPERAQLALESERAKPSPRKSLIDRLEKAS